MTFLVEMHEKSLQKEEKNVILTLYIFAVELNWLQKGK